VGFGFGVWDSGLSSWALGREGGREGGRGRGRGRERSAKKQREMKRPKLIRVLAGKVGCELPADIAKPIFVAAEEVCDPLRASLLDLLANIPELVATVLVRELGLELRVEG
jgi:hypothetical protein